ncbi:MAG TPA: hypothetical protein VNX47_01280, partial [Nevskia sp.]|nr:hypothetical protein [Nevskia sp.]
MDMTALFSGDAKSGNAPLEAVAELQKALQAGYGTDVATLTGGGALRIQSLEMHMLATIQQNEHFRLFNSLQKSNATATVDEWTEQRAVGSFLGGSTNSESGVIPQATGTYVRRTGLVKYLMTMRQVTFVTTLQNSLEDAESVEYQAGALQLLSDAEYLSFEGNSAVVATEFDGIEAQIIANATPDHVVDLRGTPLNSVVPLNNGAVVVAGYGNYGRPTDIFMSLNTQADFDSYLDPAFRVPLTDVKGGGIEIGAPVRGIRTSHGDVKTQPDIFIRDEPMKMPFEAVLNGQYLAQATANNGYQPAALAAVAGAPSGGVTSLFNSAQQAGNYYYAAAGTTAAGDSQV